MVVTTIHCLLLATWGGTHSSACGFIIQIMFVSFICSWTFCMQGRGATCSEEGNKGELYCEATTATATATSQHSTKAEASDPRFTVCKHEGTEDEGFISTEQWKTKWRWPAKAPALGKRSIWQLIRVWWQTHSLIGIINCLRDSSCFTLLVEVVGWHWECIAFYWSSFFCSFLRSCQFFVVFSLIYSPVICCGITIV